MHHQIKQLEGPMGSPGLQQSHGTEFILSLPLYLLMGSFFVLVMVPVSWESVSLLGRVPTAGAVLSLCSWVLGHQGRWLQLIALPGAAARSVVCLESAPHGSSLPFSKEKACWHLVVVTADAQHPHHETRFMISALKIPKEEEKKNPNPHLGARERSRNWKEILRERGISPVGQERRGGAEGSKAVRGQQ